MNSLARHGHTEADYGCLIGAGVDPSTTQPREHAVGCTGCGRKTWNQMGRCDRIDCYRPPSAVTRKRTVGAVA